MSRLTVSLPLPARLQPEGRARRTVATRTEAAGPFRQKPEGIGRPRTSNLNSVAHVI
jgi:hypothetical protein